MDIFVRLILSLLIEVERPTHCGSIIPSIGVSELLKSREHELSIRLHVLIHCFVLLTVGVV